MLSKKKVAFGIAALLTVSMASSTNVMASVTVGTGGVGTGGSCKAGSFATNYPDNQYVCHSGGGSIYSAPAWIHYTFTSNFVTRVRNGAADSELDQVFDRFILAPATGPTGGAQYAFNNKDDLRSCIEKGGDGFYRLGTLEAKRGIHYGKSTGTDVDTIPSTTTTTATGRVIFTSLKPGEGGLIGTDQQPVRFGVDGRLSMQGFENTGTVNDKWMDATTETWKDLMASENWNDQDAWGQYIYWGSVSPGTLIASAVGRSAFSSPSPKDGEAYQAFMAAGGDGIHNTPEDFYNDVNSFCAMPEKISADFKGTVSLKYGSTTSSSASGPTVDVGVETNTIKVQRNYEVKNVSGNDIPPYLNAGKGTESWTVIKSPDSSRQGKTYGASNDYVNWHVWTAPIESSSKNSSTFQIRPGETIEYCMTVSYSKSAVRESGKTTYSDNKNTHEACMTFKRPILLSNIHGSVQGKVSSVKNGTPTTVKDHLFSDKVSTEVIVHVSTADAQVEMGEYACRTTSGEPGIPNYLADFNAQFSNDFNIDTQNGYSSINHTSLSINGGEATGLRLKIDKNAGVCGTDSQWQKQGNVKTYNVTGLKPGQMSDPIKETYTWRRQFDNQSLPTEETGTDSAELVVRVVRDGYDCGDFGENNQYEQFGEGVGANMAYVRTWIGNKYGYLSGRGATSNYPGGDGVSETQHYIAPGTNFMFSYGVCAGGAFAAKYSEDIANGDQLAKDNTQFIWTADPAQHSNRVSHNNLTSYMFAFSAKDFQYNRASIDSRTRVYSYDHQSIDFGNNMANNFLKEPNSGSSRGFNAGIQKNKMWYAAGGNDSYITSPGSSIRINNQTGAMAASGEANSSSIYAMGNTAMAGFTTQDTKAKRDDQWVVGLDSDVGTTISQSIAWKTLTFYDSQAEDIGGMKKATAKVSIPYNYYMIPALSTYLEERNYVGSRLNVSVKTNVKPRTNDAIEGGTDKTYATETKPTRVALSWFTVPNSVSPDEIKSNLSHSFVLAKDNGYSFNPCMAASNNAYGNGSNCKTFETADKIVAKGDETLNIGSSDGKFTIPNMPIGTKLCFVVSAYPFDSHGYVNYDSNGKIKRKYGNEPDMDILGENAVNLQEHALTQHTNGDDRWYVSAPSCTTIGKKPSLSVEGGAAFVKGSVTTSTMTITGSSSKNRFGSWTESMLVSGGPIKNFATGAAAAYGYKTPTHQISINAAQGGAGASIKNANYSSEGETRLLNTQTLKNIGNPGYVDAQTTDRIASYIQQLTYNLKMRFKDTENKSSGSSNITFKGCSYQDGAYKPINNDGTYRCREKDGLAYVNLKRGTYNKEIDSISFEWPDYTSNHSNRTLVIDAGDSSLYINKDINVYQGSVSYLSEIPHVIIFAKNVFIGPQVTRLDAWIFAEKKINTCAANSSNGNYGGGQDYDWAGLIKVNPNDGDSSTSAKTCSNQLVVNGLVSASEFKLNRTYGAGTGENIDELMRADNFVKRAEIFNLTPLDYYWAYNESVLEGTLTTSFEHELPTRL